MKIFSFRGYKLIPTVSAALLALALIWGGAISLSRPKQSESRQVFASESFEENFEMGKRNFLLRKFEPAAKFFEKADIINPGSEELANMLAVSYYNLREYEKAKKIYENLLGKNPASASILNSLGNTLRDLKDFSSAEAKYRKVIVSDPEFVTAYSNLAYLLRDQGKTDEARRVIEEGLKNNPASEALENVKVILK